MTHRCSLSQDQVPIFRADWETLPLNPNTESPKTLCCPCVCVLKCDILRTQSTAFSQACCTYLLTHLSTTSLCWANRLQPGIVTVASSNVISFCSQKRINLSHTWGVICFIGVTGAPLPVEPVLLNQCVMDDLGHHGHHGRASLLMSLSP